MLSIQRVTDIPSVGKFISVASNVFRISFRLCLVTLEHIHIPENAGDLLSAADGHFS